MLSCQWRDTYALYVWSFTEWTQECYSLPHFTPHAVLAETEMARGLAKQVKVHSCTSACPQRSCQCCTSPEAPSLSTAPAMLVTRVPSGLGFSTRLAHQSFQHIFSWQINSSFYLSVYKLISLLISCFSTERSVRNDTFVKSSFDLCGILCFQVPGLTLGSD